jgi:hypothetical protein
MGLGHSPIMTRRAFFGTGGLHALPPGAQCPARSNKGYPECGTCDCTRKVRFQGETLLDHLRCTVAQSGEAAPSAGRSTRWMGWRGDVSPDEARRNQEGEARAL